MLSVSTVLHFRARVGGPRPPACDRIALVYRRNYYSPVYILRTTVRAVGYVVFLLLQ